MKEIFGNIAKTLAEILKVYVIATLLRMSVYHTYICLSSIWEAWLIGPESGENHFQIGIQIWFYLYTRVLSWFFVWVGHETMYASSENKHFFTKSCHRQTYQNYEQSQQKIGTILGNKVSWKSNSLKEHFNKKCFWKFRFLKYFIF